MKIQILTPDSFPEKQLKVLLKGYCLEEFYLKTIKSNLDFDEFLDFKVTNIKKRVELGHIIWQVIDESHNIIAVFGLLRSDNRSKNFELEYYEINPLVNFSSYAYKALELFETEVLHSMVIKKNIQYLKVKINASDYYNIDAFSKLGYVFLGTGLNLFLSKQKHHKDPIPPTHLEFKSMSDKYIDSIKSILMHHSHNEDFYDKDIKVKNVQENFYQWLYSNYLTERARKANNTEIILLYDNQKEQVVGFTCYTKEPRFSHKFKLNLITRDLTIIPEEHHNKGYGSMLFDEIMRRENKNVELKLMSNNYKAIGFNNRKGFKQVSSAHYFRKLFINKKSDNAN